MQSVEIVVPTYSSIEATRVALLFMQTARIKNTVIHNPVKQGKSFSVRIDYQESETLHEEES